MLVRFRTRKRTPNDMLRSQRVAWQLTCTQLVIAANHMSHPTSICESCARVRIPSKLEFFFKSSFLQLLKLLLTGKDHGFTRFRIVILRLNYWLFLETNLVLCLASWDQQYVLSKHHRIVSVDLWYACIELHRLSLHEYFHRNKWIVYHARSFSSSIRAPQPSQELQNLPGVLKLLGRKWTLGRVLIYLPREKSLQTPLTCE